MPVEDQIGVGIMLGALFWAALFGGAVALGALGYFFIGPAGRKTGRERMARDRNSAGSTIELPQPAEEGARLDDWSEDRIDRAA